MPAGRDLKIAAGLALMSAAAAAAVFGMMLRAEEPRLTLSTSLSSGHPYLLLKSPAGCAGALSVSATHQMSHHLTASGTVFVSADGRIRPALVNVEATFNPLGQLVSAGASLTAPGMEIIVSANGVKKVAIRCSGSNGSRPISAAVSVPGPFLLRPAGEAENYDISASWNGDYGPSAAEIRSLREHLDLDFAPAGPPPSGCDAPLEFDAAAAALRNFFIERRGSGAGGWA